MSLRSRDIYSETVKINHILGAKNFVLTSGTGQKLQ